MPQHSQPRFSAARTVARMTAFRPGASPPPVEMAILRMGSSFIGGGRIAGASHARMCTARARTDEPRLTGEARVGCPSGWRSAIELLHAPPRALLRRHRALQVDLAVMPEQVAGDA